MFNEILRHLAGFTRHLFQLQGFQPGLCVEGFAQKSASSIVYTCAGPKAGRDKATDLTENQESARLHRTWIQSLRGDFGHWQTPRRRSFERIAAW